MIPIASVAAMPDQLLQIFQPAPMISRDPIDLGVTCSRPRFSRAMVSAMQAWYGPSRRQFESVYEIMQAYFSAHAPGSVASLPRKRVIAVSVHMLQECEVY